MFNTIEKRYLDKLPNRKIPKQEKSELVVQEKESTAKVNVVGLQLQDVERLREILET